MNGVAHTKGPWAWTAEDASMCTLLGPNGEHVISSTICRTCQADHKEWRWGRCYTASEANARLIAAAPDLLEALAKIVDWMADDNKADRGLELTQAARAAILKAQGVG